MILVTGPTGNIGSLLVQELLQRKAAVRALVRNPDKDRAKIDALRAQGVEIVRGDLAQPDSLPAALRGVQSVSCSSRSVRKHFWSQRATRGRFIPRSARAAWSWWTKGMSPPRR